MSVSAGNVTPTGATLTLTGHSGAWSYKRTSPQNPPSSCTAMPNGTYTASLTGLESGTRYAYDVFTTSDCAAGSNMGSVSFTTTAASTSPTPNQGSNDPGGGRDDGSDGDGDGQTGDGNDTDTGGGGTGGGGEDTGGEGDDTPPEPVPAIPGLGAALLAGLLALAGIVRRRVAG